MKILFDKESNSVTIIDDVKRRNIFFGIIMIFNMLIIGWNIFHYHSEEFNFPLWLWIISFLFLIFSGIYRLLFIVFKTTGQSQIKVSEIEFVKFHRFRKWRSFYIYLRNGKRREVMVRLDQNDYEIMVERCNSFGIEMRPNKNR